MTLPDLLQSIALIAIAFAILATGTGSPAATCLVLLALILTAVAFIIKTDHKPRWHR